MATPASTVTAIAESQYIIDAYTRISRRHGAFQQTGNIADMVGALSDLCRELRKLVADEEFWAGLNDLLKGAPSNWIDSIADPIKDVNAHKEAVRQFLDKEAELLSELGYDRAVIDSVIADVGLALSILHDTQSGQAVASVKLRMTALANNVCFAAADIQPPQHRWRSVQLLRRGLVALGCMGFIVLNAVALIRHNDSVTAGQSLAGGLRAAMVILPPNA